MQWPDKNVYFYEKYDRETCRSAEQSASRGGKYFLVQCAFQCGNGGEWYDRPDVESITGFG